MENMQRIEEYFYKKGNITPISHTDEEQFYQYVEHTPIQKISFENNWPYILQATRDRGLKFIDNKSILYFFIRNNQVVVVHRLGKDRYGLLREIRNFAQEKGFSTLVKNVDNEEVEQLKKMGFAEAVNPWNSFSPKDDNSFPQVICNIKPIVDLDNDSIRRTTRQYIRRYKKTRNIIVKPYNKNFESRARVLLKNYSKYLERKGVEDSGEVYAAHAFFFNENVKSKIRLAHLENGDLVALSYVVQVGEDIYGNAIINKNESNLMKFIVWQVLDYLYRNKTPTPRRISMQGSEKSGQYSWKQGFRPSEILSKTHMVST